MGRKKLSGKKYSGLCESYFRQCREQGRHPSLPGLALAFGLDSREELDELAAGRGRAAKAARRAVTRVEEANVQSVYSKDTAQSAKFILQSGFGYGEKQGRKAREDIKVEIEQ
jgi:hypothetical protein